MRNPHNFPNLFSKISYLRIFSLLLLLTTFSVGCTTEVSRKETDTQEVSAQEVQELAEQGKKADVALVVIAYLQVKPEQRETFLKLASNTGKLTNEKEEGSISYAFYEDPDVKNSFFFFEEWKSKEAFEAHLEEPHTKELVGRYPELLEGAADIKIYDIKNVEKTQIPEE